MAQKKVAWKDDSGDNITLTADAWSGTQQVTVQTPENFGKYRALNIVFYSVADATKSATLKVTQEAATASLSPNTVVFDNTETAAKTITLSTNISTLSSTSIALEGADASQFTLSTLSALSNGKATFTIKPNSVNQGTSSRNCSIKVTVGRLDVMNIPVEQLADAVVKTEYLNYHLDSGVFTYNGNSIGTGAVVDILPSSGTLSIQGQVRRTKKVTYASGRTETTQENVPAGNTIYYVVEIKDVGGFIRSTNIGSTSAGSFTTGEAFGIGSLGYTLYDGNDGELYVTLSDKSISTSELSVANNLSIQKNIRVSYSNFSSIQKTQGATLPGDGSGTSNANVGCYGTCTYSSGATRTENVPLRFESATAWLKINSQTPGAAGTTLASSSAIVSATGANPSTTSSRNATLNVYPVNGSTLVTTFTVIQSAATPSLGTLYLRGSFVGFDEKFSVDAVDSVGRLFYDSAPTLQSSSLIKCSYEFTFNVVEASLATYNNLKARNNKGIIREGTINKIMINDLIDGVDVYVNLS